MNYFFRMKLNIVFGQPMGAKQPLLKQAEPVDYFSQLSATN
jgi:hypothetical protein